MVFSHRNPLSVTFYRDGVIYIRNFAKESEVIKFNGKIYKAEIAYHFTYDGNYSCSVEYADNTTVKSALAQFVHHVSLWGFLSTRLR